MVSPTDPLSTENTPTLEGLLARREVDAWVLCGSSPNAPAFIRLDWRFRGALSRALQAGALASESGEVSLLPCTRPIADQGSDTFRILNLGVKSRTNVSTTELGSLLRNVRGLGLKKIGVSASDFGWTAAETKKNFSSLKGVETCVIE